MAIVASVLGSAPHLAVTRVELGEVRAPGARSAPLEPAYTGYIFGESECQPLRMDCVELYHEVCRD